MTNTNKFAGSTKDFKKILVIALALIAAVSIGYLVFTSSSAANISYATSSETQSTDNWDSYTDSDYIGASGLTIFNYPSLLYNTVPATYKRVVKTDCNYEMTLTGDDPIVDIVPKECFRDRGEHLHIGREYGFYVKTEASAYKQNYKNYVAEYNNVVDVMVFDIETSDNLSATTDRIILKVEPLFQYRFGYVDSRESYISLDTNADYYIVAKYALPADTGRVFAMPEHGFDNAVSVLNFRQTWNYYLKDISYGVSLYNVQEKNTFNADYVASEDNGSFVTQVDYKYDGIITNTDKPDTNTALEICSNISFYFGLVSMIPSPLSTLMGLFSLGFALPGFVDSCNSIRIKENMEIPAFISASNGTISATDMYSTRASQLSHYVDEDGNPKLIKVVKTKFEENTDECNVWYGMNNSATYYVKIADTSTDGNHWYTRYERLIGLRVVDKDGNQQKAVEESSYDFYLYEPIYKELLMDERTDIYTLPQNYGYYSFMPKYTSDYFVKFDTVCDMEVYYQVSGSDEWIKSDMYWMTWNSFVCRFVGGKNYKYRIKAKFAEGRKTNVLLEASDGLDEFTVDAESYYLLRFDNLVGMATMWLSNTNLYINKLFYKSDTNVFTEFPIDNFIEYDSLEVFLKENHIYYVLVRNPLKTDQSSCYELGINFTTLRDGENYKKTFKGGAPTMYYTYTVGSENSDIMFLFDGAEGIPSLRFSVVDWNGDPVPSKKFDSYNDGCVEVRNMQAGKKYYIGISTLEDVTVKPTVKTSAVSFVWKMKQDGVWKDIHDLDGIEYRNSTLFLDRGQTYEFGLWVYGYMAKYYDIVQGKDFRVDLDVLNKLIIDATKTDHTAFTLAATHDTDSKMMYNELLYIMPEFVPGEVTLDSINYVNQTLMIFDAPSDVKSISGWLQVNNSDRPSSIDDRYKIVIPSTNGIYKYDFLSELCVKRASSANFVVERITVSSGVSASEYRDIAVSSSYGIRCDYSYETSNGAYIQNELQLYNGLRVVNKLFTYLSNDIELMSFQKWPMIENYTGIFSGDNHKIKNFKIEDISGAGEYGLVGVNKGIIANLTMENVSISTKKDAIITGGDWIHVGAIAGKNEGNINSCSVTGAISVMADYGAVGGIVGSNDHNVFNCNFGSVDGAISVIAGCGDMGGIAGSSYGLISGSKVSNAQINHLALASSRSVGGIVGYGNKCSVKTSGINSIIINNLNDTKIGTQIKMGFLVGCLIDSTIADCFREGDASSCKVNIKNLSNQTYCFNGAGDWKFFGQLQNCTVDGKTNQTAP